MERDKMTEKLFVVCNKGAIVLVTDSAEEAANKFASEELDGMYRVNNLDELLELFRKQSLNAQATVSRQQVDSVDVFLSKIEKLFGDLGEREQETFRQLEKSAKELGIDLVSIKEKANKTIESAKKAGRQVLGDIKEALKRNK